MPRIACLMMLRDEALLLKPWLLYHGYLFGFENLYVYDNGSRDESVLATLRQFAASGVTVDSSHQTMAGFEYKGNIIGAKIQQFKDSGRYDIALAFDCDELIAIAGEAGPGITRTEILAEIERIHAAGAICQTTRCFYNVPGYLDRFWLAGHWKSILPVPAFRSIDHGFHRAGLAEGEAYRATSLTYIHLHHKPFAQVVAGAWQKLSVWADTSSPEAAKSHQGVGRHLTKYLEMAPEDYYAMRPEGLPFIRFTGFLRLLELFMDLAAARSAWEAGRPPALQGNPALLDLDATPFSAAAYLAANPDLEAVPNLFYHYVEAGLAEGRPINPVANPREAALRAMQEGRHAEAIPLWAKFRALFPDDQEGYHWAVIACRNAGVDPADIIAASRARFPDFFSPIMSPA